MLCGTAFLRKSFEIRAFLQFKIQENSDPNALEIRMIEHVKFTRSNDDPSNTIKNKTDLKDNSRCDYDD